MKLFFLASLAILILGCQGQNLIGQLQNPPISWESPIPTSPLDPRNAIKAGVIGAIKGGFHASAAIDVNNGGIPYQLYAGFRSIEAQDPIRNDTIFRIASMSKMVTAATAMWYEEQGLIKLNDPVSKYIQSFEKATVIKKISPDVYPFSTLETIQGSPLITIPLPSLSIPEITKLHRKEVGIQLATALGAIKLDGIFTVMSFDPSRRTISVSLACAATSSNVFSVNGTLDVLPKLPHRWTPYDYVDIPAGPSPLSPLVKVRAYYSTEPSNTITVRHLLTHTAGFGYGNPSYTADLTSLQTAIMKKRDPSLLRFPMSPNNDMDTVEWAERISRIPQMFQPGTDWTYGMQIGLLGAVLVAYERNEVCNSPSIGLYDIQKRVIFDPLGITDAGYFIKNDDPRRNDKIARLAHIYTNADTFFAQPPTPIISNLYVATFTNAQDFILPGLHSTLVDGSIPSAEGAANPHHPIYGSASPKRTEFGDAGLYMRTDEFQRIVTMLTQNGSYNGQQILQPATVAKMFSNQIGDISYVHATDPAGGVKWGYGVAVGDGSVNPEPLATTSAHWAGAFGGWWFSNQRSATSFVLNSNTLPGFLRALVNTVANITMP